MSKILNINDKDSTETSKMPWKYVQDSSEKPKIIQLNVKDSHLQVDLWSFRSAIKSSS